MENLSGYTPTELLKMGNDLGNEHATIKETITKKTYQIEELEGEINELLEKLETVEKKYVEIIEEIDNRK
jgi:hypothetical protein